MITILSKNNASHINDIDVHVTIVPVVSDGTYEYPRGIRSWIADACRTHVHEA